MSLELNQHHPQVFVGKYFVFYNLLIALILVEMWTNTLLDLDRYYLIYYYDFINIRLIKNINTKRLEYKYLHCVHNYITLM